MIGSEARMWGGGMLKKTKIYVVILILSVFPFRINEAFSASPGISQYTAFPPFSGTLTKPNVLLNVDTSFSQFYFAYDFDYNQVTSADYRDDTLIPVSQGFDSTKTYYGYFEPDEWYIYDSINGEWTTTGATTADWKGNFLNWLTMRRVDILKKVIVGGKTRARIGVTGDPHDLLGQKAFTGYDGYQKEVPDDVLCDVSPLGGGCMSTNSTTFTFNNDLVDITDEHAPMPEPITLTDVSAFSVGPTYDSTNDKKVIVHRDSEPEGVVQMVGDNVRWGLEFISDQAQYDNPDPGDTSEEHGCGHDGHGGMYTETFQCTGTHHGELPEPFIDKVNVEGGIVVVPCGYYDNNVTVTINGTAETLTRAEAIVKLIANNIPLTPATPIAESLWTATGYFQQRGTGALYPDGSYPVGNGVDPYNYADDPATDTDWTPCAKSFVITITDGEPTTDRNIDTTTLSDAFNTTYTDGTGALPGWEGSDYFWTLNGSHYIDEVALWGHVDLSASAEKYRDLRDDATYPDLPDEQYLTHYFIYANFGSGSPDAKRLLNWCAASGGGAARNGGFIDSNGDFLPDLAGEYDSDNDVNGYNDTFYEAIDGYQLEGALINAIYAILDSVSSGTAAGVPANAGAGDGALYQAYFYPQKMENLSPRKWLGNIKALNADGTSVWDGANELWKKNPDDRTIYTTTNGYTKISLETTNSLTLQPYLRAADQTEAVNIIDWIRGYDFTNDVTGNDFKAYTTDAGHPDGYRQRSITIDSDTHVWKLGDIINSTPTVVGRPMENYDLLYGDASYTGFRSEHLKRRQVAYVGANDGMLHAFNSGYYSEKNDAYCTGPIDNNGDCTTGSYALGEELWAFIPRGLLPHMKWLTDPDYTHVYYVDAKPKITDAKIFTADTTHKNGWGTILIGGFRYGGKDISWTSGSDSYSASPEYFALDITDPLSPRLLWTFSDPGLGLSMTYPSVAKIGDEWFAIFGSGAVDYDTSSNLTSFQNGNIFVLKISAGTDGVINTWTEDTNFWKISTGNSDTFMADPISVDVDIDYDTDVIYFGENYRDAGNNPNTLLRRITTNKGSESTPSDWTLSTLGDINAIAGSKDDIKRITAAPTAAMDNRANLWLFFGTGEFLGASDKNQDDTGAFYAIKDGCWNGSCGSSYTSLLDISDAEVGIDGSVTGITPCDETTVSTWSDLLSASYNCDGWAMYFDDLVEEEDFTGETLTHDGERVVSKPLVIGGLVTWTTFIPDDSACSSGGESNLYAIYYKTGSAYQNYVFREQQDDADLETPTYDNTNIARVKKLEGEVISSVSAQITSSGGTMGFAQQVTGSILQMESINPISLKSDTIGWANKPIP